MTTVICLQKYLLHKQQKKHLIINNLDGVSLKTSEKTYTNNIQGIIYIFQNDTDNEYLFDKHYYLERLENGEWFRLSLNSSRFVFDIAYNLIPHTQRNGKLNLKCYGSKFESGHYRIVGYQVPPEICRILTVPGTALNIKLLKTFISE